MKKLSGKSKTAGPVTEPTNCSLRKRIKYPALKLAASLDLTISELIERVLEVQLVKRGLIKSAYLDELKTPPDAEVKKE